MQPVIKCLAHPPDGRLLFRRFGLVISKLGNMTVKILDVLNEHIPEAATGFNIIFSYPCG
jgi:hypothetical protein